MIYKIEVREEKRTATWDVYHMRAKDFATVIEKINKKLAKSYVKLAVKSIQETDLKVS